MSRLMMVVAQSMVTSSLILIAIIPLGAQTHVWRLGTTATDGTQVYYDASTVTKLADTVSVWEKYVHNAKASNERTEMVRSEYNCKSKFARQVFSTIYDGVGNAISTSNRATQWSPVVPDSIGEKLLRIQCVGDADRQEEQEANQHYDQGKEYLEAKNYSMAIYELQLASSTIKSWYVYDALGNAFEESGRFREASEAYKHEVQVEPLKHYGYVNLGRIYGILGQTRLAIDTFIVAVGLNPESEFRLDEFLRKETNVQKRIVLLKYVLLHHPVGEKMDELAELYDKTNQRAAADAMRMKAISYFEGVIKTREKSSDFTNLYLLYSHFEQSQKAIALLVLGVSKFPNEVLFWHFLAAQYLKAQRFAEARNSIKKGLDIEEGRFLKNDLLKQLIEANMKLGRIDEARQSVEKYYGLDPAQVWIGYAYLATTQGENEPEQSMIAVEKSIQSKPDYALAYMVRGSILERLNKRAEAIRDYQFAIGLNSEFVEARVALAKLLIKTGDSQAARIQYEFLLKQNPKSASELLPLFKR